MSAINKLSLVPTGSRTWVVPLYTVASPFVVSGEYVVTLPELFMVFVTLFAGLMYRAAAGLTGSAETVWAISVRLLLVNTGAPTCHAALILAKMLPDAFCHLYRSKALPTRPCAINTMESFVFWTAVLNTLLELLTCGMTSLVPLPPISTMPW